ncbi:MAG: MFS transporter [Armatimonadetes bacterium]|nr:MFS transporter [Armatimonadota bacterium]
MKIRNFASISVLWLPISLFWSAVLAQVLAERVEFFVRERTIAQMRLSHEGQATQNTELKARVTRTKGRFLAFIGGLGALLSTLVQLMIGPISDNTTHPKGRRRPFILWGVLLTILPLLAFGCSRTFLQLMIAFLFIQLFLNLATGPFQALIPDLVPPEHQGKASGWMGFWNLVGQVGGLLLAGVLLEPAIVNQLLPSSPPRSPEAAASLGVLVICLVCAGLLLALLFLHMRTVHEVPFPQERKAPWGDVLQKSFDLQLKPYPDFTRLIQSRFIINIGIYTGIEFLRYYVQECLPMANRSVAIETMWVSLAATAGGVLGTFKAGSMSDTVSKRKVIYFTCAAAAFSAVLFCLNHSLTGARVVGFIFGLAYGAFCAVDWAFATNLMPPGREAKYMAIFHIAFTVPQVLVLVFGGLLADLVATHFGGNVAYRAVFWTMPVYLALGAALISKVRERHEIEAACP